MTISLRYILLFLFLPFLSFNMVGQRLLQDPQLIKKKLSNGLTYYIYPTDQGKNQADVRLFVKTGSLQEADNQLGLAHFLEHMAFNGIKHFKANELIRFLNQKVQNLDMT